MAVLIEKYAKIDRSFFIFRRTVGISVEKLFPHVPIFTEKNRRRVRQARVSTVYVKGRTPSCFFQR